MSKYDCYFAYYTGSEPMAQMYTVTSGAHCYVPPQATAALMRATETMVEFVRDILKVQ